MHIINSCLIKLLFPGGPYGAFGGRDASRGLATFNVESKDDFEYDDLSDLSAMEMDSVREWELQFKGMSTCTTPISLIKRQLMERTNYIPVLFYCREILPGRKAVEGRRAADQLFR